MNQTRILQVVPCFHPSWGGPVKVVSSISKKLAENGHEVTVYTSDYGWNSEKTKVQYLDGVTVHFFRNINASMARTSKFFVSYEFSEFLRQEIKHFDIAHLHEYRTFQNIVVHHYLKKYRVPYVLQAHGSLFRIMEKQKLKLIYDLFFGYKLLRDSSKVIALSQTEARQYRDVGVPEEKITVIPNGIDLTEYDNLPPKGCFRKKFNIDEEEKVVLYLGRIHRIKGLDVLVKAFANVIHKIEDVKLVVVGPDDGYFSELEALTNSLKLDDKVLILSPLYGNDKLKAYVDADVYTMPSIYETFPMGLLEAYSCGKPVVASKVGGLKDLVIDGATGFLVKPGDVEQLTHSILSLLNDNNRAEEMGLRGEQFVKKNFTLENVVERFERLYKDVISSPLPTL